MTTQQPASRSPITTHVLDTALGLPAAGMPITLERQSGGSNYEQIGQGVTNTDGRVTDLLPAGSISEGVYRITFNTAAYYAATGQASFYPAVSILFHISMSDQHYHVPLLLSPYGYSTYRGS